MLQTRMLSALVGMPIILCVSWYGGAALFIFTSLIMLLGTMESMRLFNPLNIHPNLVVTVLSLLLILGSSYFGGYSYLGGSLTFIVIFHLLLIIKTYPNLSQIDMAAGIFTTMYLSLFIYIYFIRLLPNGCHWLIMLWFSTWASDSFAYFVGKTMGKHKMAPKLSPKKTWEGALGGIIGTEIIVYAYTSQFMSISFTNVIFLGLFISIAGQLGDLVESTMKRQAQLKDSGNLIPGHGGVLDRFDSMLLIAPLVYYYILAFII